MNKIMIIEDDEILNGGLCYNLQKRGIIPVPAYTLAEAKKLLAEASFDLILLDVNLPDGDGFQFARDRLAPLGLPFMFLTARDLDEEIIGGYRLGADDYISKPFRVNELMARIKSVLRRYNSENGKSGIIELHGLKINTNEAKVYKNGAEIILTAMEYRLLLILVNNRGRVLTRTQLLENIWDIDGIFVNDNTLTVYIKRLRDKIEDNSDEPGIIKTVRKMGYIME